MEKLEISVNAESLLYFQFFFLITLFNISLNINETIIKKQKKVESELCVSESLASIDKVNITQWLSDFYVTSSNFLNPRI